MHRTIQRNDFVGIDVPCDQLDQTVYVNRSGSHSNRGRVFRVSCNSQSANITRKRLNMALRSATHTLRQDGRMNLAPEITFKLDRRCKRSRKVWIVRFGSSDALSDEVDQEVFMHRLVSALN